MLSHSVVARPEWVEFDSRTEFGGANSSVLQILDASLDMYSGSQKSCKGVPQSTVQITSLDVIRLTWPFLHGGRLPVRPDTNLPLPPPLDAPTHLVSTWLELATWVLAAPREFFEPGKFAKHLIPPQLFTLKMLTMS